MHVEKKVIILINNLDIIDYGKFLLDCGKRMIFEIIHELEEGLPEYENIKNQVINVGKYTFNGFKSILEVLNENFIKEKNIYQEVEQKESEFYEKLLTSMNSEILKLIVKANQDIQTIIKIKLSLSKEQIEDISLFSNFFKTNIKDVFEGLKKIKAYELSSKEKNILVNELIFNNQYGKLSRSYDVHVPINILFDSSLYKNKLLKSSRDRARGFKFLINSWFNNSI
jgi:hypothetical protein